MAEDKAACICYLVVEELTEVLLVHLALLCINYSCESVQLYIMCIDIAYCIYNIAELSDARRLDKDTVRLVLFKYLYQCLAEITNEAAAYTSGVHFCDLNACILQESAVNTDLSELIFDKNELLALISFIYKLLDKCCLTSSKKAGKDSYLCHTYQLLSILLPHPRRTIY